MKSIIKPASIQSLNNSLITRFDTYFGERTDKRTQELRKYVNDYFRLTWSVDAFVPRVFVVRLNSINSLSSFITVPFNICSAFPPSDYVTVNSVQAGVDEVEILGYKETEKLVHILSPFLCSIEGYTATKKLSSEYRDSSEIQQMVINAVRPLSELSAVEGIDMIPTFEEEMSFYEAESIDELISRRAEVRENKMTVQRVE